MGKRVQRIKTSVSEAQMSQAIIEVWHELFGNDPSKEQVSIILAQNALETANRNSMWNFNIGNITTDGNGPYNFFDDLTTKEQITPGNWVKKNLKYRAYASLKEGVKDYLKFIKNNYHSAWNNIMNPNPVAFSKSLKQKGYYTANEAPYTKSLSKWYNKFMNSNNELAVNQNSSSKNNISNINDVLDNYIKLVAATEKKNNKLYQKFLPQNNVLIKIKASNFVDGIEFSKVLCSILNEDLLAKAYTHTDGTNIDVEISIPGPGAECFDLINQLTECAKEGFFDATKKIGGIDIDYSIIINKTSSYKPITFKTADSQHRKFLLKFA